MANDIGIQFASMRERILAVIGEGGVAWIVESALWCGWEIEIEFRNHIYFPSSRRFHSLLSLYKRPYRFLSHPGLPHSTLFPTTTLNTSMSSSSGSTRSLNPFHHFSSFYSVEGGRGRGVEHEDDGVGAAEKGGGEGGDVFSICRVPGFQDTPFPALVGLGNLHVLVIKPAPMVPRYSDKKRPEMYWTRL
jgi:hypothetical protein